MTKKRTDDETPKIIYEELAKQIDYETLPSIWQYNMLGNFSESKKLYDYQIEALKNSIKLLWKFYSYHYEYPKIDDNRNFTEAKKKLYKDAISLSKGIENLELSSKNNKIVDDISRFYGYKEERGYKKIHFFNFVNRMGFWMATASGKTLVIVKLIELLDYYINNNLIPRNDILILTYREGLIKQIREHIDEYNSFHNKKIDLYDLRDYDKVKYGSILTNKDNINVFIYRSDLVADETKEKQLSYKDVDNDGKWYVILDEAHKGDKEDSKRQIYYSFLTRFGFLFNFSATFTDPWDVATTIYNFNLDIFIGAGYGKNVYLSQKGINLNEFDQSEKEKIVLKSFILLTVSKITYERIKNVGRDVLYHNPLMVIYGNSVNTDEADLKIVFRVIENIAKNIGIENFNSAKNEIIDELSKNIDYVYGEEKFNFAKDLIEGIESKHILKYVFNSDSYGSIEVITIPKNNKELVFKVKSSDKPFALIKIGNIKEWIKNEFKDYEINESYDNKSYFNDINNIDNTINILLGSRSFYEGWDSNRPNVMMFINIGTGDSKKYVLQSIGRGVRIEPMKNERKRLKFLANGNVKVKDLYNKIDSSYLSLIETLFVFGTSVKNVKNILDAIKFEREKSGQLIELNKNKEVEDKALLVPEYKIRSNVNVDEIPKFTGNYELIKSFISWLKDDKILYAIYADSIRPSDIERLKGYIKRENFNISNEDNALIQLMGLFDHINISLEDIDRFKELEGEIVHFRHISAILKDDDLESLKKKINKVLPQIDRPSKIEELKKKLNNKEIDIDEYTKGIQKLSTLLEVDTFSSNNETIQIKNIKNHYYLPVLISEDSKADFINHIINVESERKFLENLEDYVKQSEINVDYWFFSKIDEDLDKIYIPYYNKKYNKESKFFPDFIFWIKKENTYYIIFVDPKGIEHTDYEYKVDGYKIIYEEYGKPKEFRYNNFIVKVFLYLYTEDKNKLPNEYKRYWFSSIDNIFNIVNE